MAVSIIAIFQPSWNSCPNLGKNLSALLARNQKLSFGQK